MEDGAGEVPGWPIKGGKSEGRESHNRMVKEEEKPQAKGPGEVRGRKEGR